MSPLGQQGAYAVVFFLRCHRDIGSLEGATNALSCYTLILCREANSIGPTSLNI